MTNTCVIMRVCVWGGCTLAKNEMLQKVQLTVASTVSEYPWNLAIIIQTAWVAL